MSNETEKNENKKMNGDNVVISDDKTEENTVMIPIVLSKNPHVKKMTLSKQKEFLGYLIYEWNVTKAAHKIGVNRRSIYEFIKNNHSFKVAFEEIKEAHLDEIECNLVNEGKTRNFTPGIFLLKSHRRSVYGDKVDLDITHDFDLTNVNQALKNLLEKTISSPVAPVIAEFTVLNSKGKNENNK